jgi:hypothetical protein
MTRVVLLTLAALAACGCASQWAYHKADATGAERQADEEACRRDATVPRVSRPLVFSGGRLVSYPFMGVDPQIYARCLEAKGYIVTGN